MSRLPTLRDSAAGLFREDERFLRQKREVHQRLITGMDLAALTRMSEDGVRREIRRAAEEMCQYGSNLLTPGERERLVSEVLDEAFGLGPLEPLLRDPLITDIMINGPRMVYVERGGKIEQTPVVFEDARHLTQIVQRIVGRVGRRVDETSPMIDARLPDGSRINAVIPPLAIDGPLVSIRRFGAQPLLLPDLIARKSLTEAMVTFLSACIGARLNLLISGGTGSGKTTLLNALSACISHDERLVTIEDAAELRLQQPHVARMETRPTNVEGIGAVTTRDLVRNALRMRPDRIIVGECRGPEALDMLQAMNTGHDGSMTTLHANDTHDAISRLEIMVSMTGFSLPLWSISRQMASAIHLIIQVSRLRGGARKIVKISEITGLEEGRITLHDLFWFKQTHVDETGRARGNFHVTDRLPKCWEELEVAGTAIPASIFNGQVVSD